MREILLNVFYKFSFESQRTYTAGNEQNQFVLLASKKVPGT